MPALPHPVLPADPGDDVDPFAPGRVLPVAAIAAAFVALSVSAQTYLSMLGHGHSFWRMAGWQLCVSGLLALLAPVVLRLGATDLGRNRISVRQVVTVTAVGVAAIGAHLVAAAYLSLWLQPFTPQVSVGFESALRAQFGSQLASDVLLFALLLVLGRTLAEANRSRMLAIRESRLEAELTRATLDALRLEIQPHFLFNTLNSLAALIRKRANDKALEMLLGLSELMRATVDRSPEHLASLAAEAEFTRRYLAIQAARFGDRVQTRFSIAPDTADLQVPSFLLQPLVENALRHGIAPLERRCLIEVSSVVEHGMLIVDVRDDGAGVPAGFELGRDEGTGLRNIRVRLQYLFGDATSLSVRPRAGGGTHVTVMLPARRADSTSEVDR